MLRLLLDESPQNWYRSALERYTLQSDWDSWRDSFLETYAEKGWAPLRYAYTFRYINGSLLEYTLKKETLLIEADPKLAIDTRINLIVLGLPVYIQNRIDKEEIKTLENLMNELRKLEPLTESRRSKFRKKEETGRTSPKLLTVRAQSERKPCPICEGIGKPNRWHPEALCRSKKEASEKIKLVNNTELEKELNKNVDQKN